jgi:diketogulonate reductase-like aldo/keto reductase
MLMRAIPSSGEKIPAIGLGTWQAFDIGASAGDRAPRREVLQRFLAAGGRVVDSSPMYGRSERVVGDLAAELGIVDQLWIATKVWISGRDEGIAQMERSLNLLRKAPLDLMQVHNLLDWRTHLATMRAWKDAGRLRYVGITHYTSSGYDQLERVLRSEPVDFVQLNYSLEEREAEQRLLPLAQDRGVAVLVNRPFAAGGSFRSVRNRPLPAEASELGCTSWAELFLKWILGHPAVTCVIPATSSPEHLADNMRGGVGPLPDASTRTRLASTLGRS